MNLSCSAPGRRKARWPARATVGACRSTPPSRKIRKSPSAALAEPHGQSLVSPSYPAEALPRQPCKYQTSGDQVNAWARSALQQRNERTIHPIRVTRRGLMSDTPKSSLQHACHRRHVSGPCMSCWHCSVFPSQSRAAGRTVSDDAFAARATRAPLSSSAAKEKEGTRTLYSTVRHSTIRYNTVPARGHSTLQEDGHHERGLGLVKSPLSTTHRWHFGADYGLLFTMAIIGEQRGRTRLVSTRQARGQKQPILM